MKCPFKRNYIKKELMDPQILNYNNLTPPSITNKLIISNIHNEGIVNYK